MAREAYKPNQKKKSSINTRSQTSIQNEKNLKKTENKKSISAVEVKKSKAIQKNKNIKQQACKTADVKSKSSEEEKKAIQFLFGNEESNQEHDQNASQEESCDKGDSQNQSNGDIQPGDEEKQQKIKEFYDKFRKHQEQSDDKISCPQKDNNCKFKTISLRMLKEHLRSEHSTLLLRLGICEATCEFCKKAFYKRGIFSPKTSKNASEQQVKEDQLKVY